MEVWALDTGMDTGFEVRVLGWTSGPWHEGLRPDVGQNPRWRSGPQREVSVLGWRSGTQREICVLGWRPGPRIEDWALEECLIPGMEVWVKAGSLGSQYRNRFWVRGQGPGMEFWALA